MSDLDEEPANGSSTTLNGMLSVASPIDTDIRDSLGPRTDRLPLSDTLITFGLLEWNVAKSMAWPTLKSLLQRFMAFGMSTLIEPYLSLSERYLVVYAVAVGNVTVATIPDPTSSDAGFVKGR